MKKEKPKKNKKNKYVVKDEKENILPIEVPESFIKILEAMDKGKNKK